MQINFCTNFGAPPSSFGPFVTATTATAIWELQTSPTDDFLLLAVMADTYANVFGSLGYSLGIGVPAARGIGQTVYQPPVAENNMLSAQLPAVTLYTAWSTRPTAPAAYLRRMVFQVSSGSQTAGAGRYRHLNWRFPNGLRVPPNSSLALFGVGIPSGAAEPVPIDFALIGEN